MLSQYLANASAPTSKAELQSFLSLCTFLSRFIPNFYEKTKNLRQLIKKNVPFVWGKKQEKDFQILKQE